jgi:hypothetical protein
VQQAGSLSWAFYLQTKAYLCRMQHDLAFGWFSARYILQLAEHAMKREVQNVFWQ